MDRKTIDWYDRNAEDVALRYESVPGGISDFFRFVVAPGDSVLERGSGSGRDAARLMDLGEHVHAVEPSAGLRHQYRLYEPLRCRNWNLPENGRFEGEPSHLSQEAIWLRGQLLDSRQGSLGRAAIMYIV